MAEFFDLSKLLSNINPLVPDQDTPQVDLSGRPPLSGVTAVLKSGLKIPCDVKYDGSEPGQFRPWRRYRIIAESVDWSTNPIELLEIDVMPRDVSLIINTPDMPDAEHATYNVAVDIKKVVD